MIRRGVQLFSLLLFPATFYYLSPVISLMGAQAGIVTGSIVVFAILFLTAPFTGRLFCSWLCPGGAIGDVAAVARPRAVRQRRLQWGKYVIWLPWFSGLLALLLGAGGVHAVEPGYATVAGMSVTDVHALIAYLLVAVVFFGLAVAVGRRAPCHTICWIAPFMVFGRALGRNMGIPGVRLVSNREGCVACGRCTAVCPMSLPVETMVSADRIEHHDCILCGECADRCPTNCIRLGWERPKRSGLVTRS